jgi:hypothetical protein
VRASERGAAFKSLADPWVDTSSPMGEFMLTVLGGVATLELPGSAEPASRRHSWLVPAIQPRCEEACQQSGAPRRIETDVNLPRRQAERRAAKK